jgi:hypothetical protein
MRLIDAFECGARANKPRRSARQGWWPDSHEPRLNSGAWLALEKIPAANFG